jgi:hypothetical protein
MLKKSLIGLSLLASQACWAADTYNPATNQLSIPSVNVAGTLYGNVVITVGSVVRIDAGTPAGSVDVYNPATNQLSIPSVLVNGTLYSNVVISVGQVLRVGGSSEKVATLTGTFIDGPVQGLTYTASPSGITGITGIDGSYKFLQTDTTINFKIGGDAGVQVASSTPSTDPLFVGALPNSTLIAQVLVSLNGGASDKNLDVSNVKLDSKTANLITSYISNADIAGKSDSKSLMSDIQNGVANASGVNIINFKNLGGVDDSQTETHLATSASTLPVKTDIALNPTGKSFFITSYKTKKDGVTLNPSVIEYFFGVRETPTKQTMITTDGRTFSGTITDLGSGKFRMDNYQFSGVQNGKLDCVTTSSLSSVKDANFTAQTVSSGVCENAEKTMIGQFIDDTRTAANLANTQKYLPPMSICGGSGASAFMVNYGPFSNGSGSFTMTGGDCGAKIITGTYTDSDIKGVVKISTTDTQWFIGIVDSETLAYFMDLKVNGSFVQKKGGFIRKPKI